MDGAYGCQESEKYQGIYTLAHMANIIKKNNNNKKLWYKETCRSVMANLS